MYIYIYQTFMEEFLQSTLYLISQDFTKRGLNIYIYIYIYIYICMYVFINLRAGRVKKRVWCVGGKQ